MKCINIDSTVGEKMIGEIMTKEAKKKSEKIIIIILIVLGIIGIVYVGFQLNCYMKYEVAPLNIENENVDFQKATKLMIVAHPDDDLLWGGSHLLEGEYLVVCITSGNHKVRANEFQKVMEATENQGIILDYPDKINGKRDDWKSVRHKINADLATIMRQKNWDLIVTHNEKGEYGHIHHIITNQIVTEIHDSFDMQSALFFFCDYYKKNELSSIDGEKLSDEIVSKKKELLELYDSQKKTIDKFSHMIPYENWIKR